MSMKRPLLDFTSKVTRTIVEIGQKEQKNETKVNILLRSILMHDNILSKLNNATAYIDILRALIEPKALRVQTVKSNDQPDDIYSNRFKTLIETIKSNLLPIPVPMALELAKEADQLAGMTAPFNLENWAGDVGLHFAISSSLGHKGRLLANIVRLCRSERCLELGTAYGMSAMFMLGMQPYLDWTIQLTTVEAWEPQFTLASQRLKERYHDGVTCHFGWTQNVLPTLMKTLGPVDFMFHDAGHSREDYVRDFEAVVDSLSPGAVMVIDDIHWQDARFGGGQANTYQGWLDVVAHARIRHAVEVDGMGLALLS